ncbi:alkaline phosphatase 4-like [Condylostylus longicornis]|uniref:alkaline phosphatase 4-like n=1 Tax=Condylostylus longicornis TaxID=2530218 RepID=UPI00244DE328|nr:alkaline phosphatase 4-like [Condylostylus longicornis]
MFELSKIYFLINLFMLLILHYNVNLSAAAVFNRNLKYEDEKYWQQIGMKYLKKRINLLDGSEIPKAKNIIFFLGDGMGMTTVTTGRIYKGQLNGNSGEDSSLVFDDFPNTGLAKTYNIDKQVPDSAGTATAIFTGVKTRYGIIGMDNSTSPFDAETGKLDSIMKWAQNVNKSTGIVTTTRITHATPAATYASIYDRDWECDSEIPDTSRGIYKDIARQLVENEPGINFNVIFGGGLKPMGNKNNDEVATVTFEGKTEKICDRTDGKNLVENWLNLTGENRQFVKNRDELMNLNIKNVSHVLGLFRNNHITYSIARQIGEPALSEMVQQAIRILSKNDNGYVLMVEGGRIDQGHHQNYAHAALQEVVEFDKAIEIALNMTNRKDTLIIVTADHSHSMTFNGYPGRGNNILGFANKKNVFPYETITYANGPGFFKHRSSLHTSYLNNTENIRFNTWIPVEEIDSNIRNQPTYKNLAAFPIIDADETHGGEDVPVFAIGPGSNLIGGVFEQNYLAYVMSYAGCMGPAMNLDKSCMERSSSTQSKSSTLIISSSLLSITLIYSILTLF